MLDMSNECGRHVPPTLCRRGCCGAYLITRFLRVWHLQASWRLTSPSPKKGGHFNAMAIFVASRDMSSKRLLEHDTSFFNFFFHVKTLQSMAKLTFLMRHSTAKATGPFRTSSMREALLLRWGGAMDFTPICRVKFHFNVGQILLFQDPTVNGHMI